MVAVLAAYGLSDAKEAPHQHGEAATSILPVLRQPQVQWLFASIFFHVLSHMGIYTFSRSTWLPRFTLTGWLVVCAAVMAFHMVGSVLGGLMGEHWGLGSIFWATAITSLLALGCAVAVWRLQHSPQGLKELP